MYKHYRSPLSSPSGTANHISRAISRFVGTLVDYNAHELAIGETRRAAERSTPIRLLSFDKVNQGYEIIVNRDEVRVVAANLGDSDLGDFYRIAIPRVEHDSRHYQLRKLEYVEIFSTLLAKSYQHMHNPVLYSNHDTKDGTTEVKISAFVAKIVDALSMPREFRLIFQRNRWVLFLADIPHHKHSEELIYYTKNQAFMVSGAKKKTAA
jgi:hypothetical protein